MTTRTSRRQSSTVGTATQRTARPLALRNLAKCSLVIQRQSGQRPPKGAADLVFSQSGRRDSNSRPSPWQGDKRQRCDQGKRESALFRWTI